MIEFSRNFFRRVLFVAIVLQNGQRTFRVDGEIHRCTADETPIELPLASDFVNTVTLRTAAYDRIDSNLSQHCRLIVRPPDPLEEPVHFVLKIKKLVKAPPSIKCRSVLIIELTGSSFNKTWDNEEMIPHSTFVIPVYRSSQLLKIRYSTEASDLSAGCGRIELNITIAKKGFCGGNMLLHRDRCLLVSDEKLQLSDLNGTGAELAAISGWEQLQELLRDNELHKNRHGSSLDLNGALRVAAFGCASSRTHLYLWEFTNGTCLAHPLNVTAHVELTGDFGIQQPPTVQCVALNFETGTKLRRIILSDCVAPAKFLLSFSADPTRLIENLCWQKTEPFCRALEISNTKTKGGASILFVVPVSIVSLLTLVAFYL